MLKAVKGMLRSANNPSQQVFKWVFETSIFASSK